MPAITKCSFQKENVVCGRRIGIRKGSGDVVLLSPPRGSVVQFNLPGKTGKRRITTRSAGSQWKSTALVADPS